LLASSRSFFCDELSSEEAELGGVELVGEPLAEPMSFSSFPPSVERLAGLPERAVVGDCSSSVPAFMNLKGEGRILIADNGADDRGASSDAFEEVEEMLSLERWEGRLESAGGEVLSWRRGGEGVRFLFDPLEGVVGVLGVADEPRLQDMAESDFVGPVEVATGLLL
jgi:hypothetical protein